MMASSVPAKGADDYACSLLTAWILSLGWKRLLLVSDNEAPLLALLRLVAANLRGIEVIPRTCPVGDSAANGLAKAAVWELKAQMRVIRSQVEQRYNQRLAEDDPLLAWTARYAASCISRFRIQHDGRTPEQRRCGRRWQRPTIEFGEQAMFHPARDKAKEHGALERSWRGVYVGHQERTGSALFLTPSGVERGTRITRMVGDERFDIGFMKTVKGVPRRMGPEGRQLQQPAAGASEIGAGVAPR